MEINFWCLSVLFIVFTPLVGSLLAGFRSNYLYCKYDHPTFINTFLMLIAFLASVSLFFYHRTNSYDLAWYHSFWFLSSNYIIDWSFRLDGITCSMFIIVTGVSFFVHLYSIYYMRGDPNIVRFFSFLSLFTFFMLILVSSSNLIQLFIGWEGVGLCSFLLISFWTERVSANKAAIKAMIVNKVGDCFFILGSAQLLQLFGTLDLSFLTNGFFWGSNYYSSLFSVSSFFFTDVHSVFPALLFLFFGVMAKSAQFGFHTWLPDAMEGPTPVSALIHAATMVTAGVVLILRLSSLFAVSSSIQLVVAVIGLLTMFFAASTALFQNDIKKVIAYSTCSQLGYMVAACGYSFYGVAFFHLLTHAFFKALLFLCAGSLIHFFNDEQDARKMGGVSKLAPLTYVSFFIATLSLLAFPYTSGFYSKDWLLELFLLKSSYFSVFGYIIGLLTALCTAFYSFKVYFSAVVGAPQSSRLSYINYHNEEKILFLVFMPLTLLSLVFGYYYKSLFFSFISFSQEHHSLFDVDIPFVLKILPFFTLLAGFAMAYIFVFKNTLSFFRIPLFKNIYLFFYNKWYFDYLYNVFLVHPTFVISRFYSYRGVEKGWIEFLGPTGLSSLLNSSSKTVNVWQNGDFYFYYFFIILGLIFFLV